MLCTCRRTELLTKVQPNARLGLEEATIPQGRPHRRRAGLYDTSHAARSANLEALNTLLDALSKEHECLYQSLVQPVAHYCCDMLPAGMHKSSRTELALEDLERLHPEQAGAVLEWLIEKVDGLSTKLKVDPKKEEEVSAREGRWGRAGQGPAGLGLAGQGAPVGELRRRESGVAWWKARRR